MTKDDRLFAPFPIEMDEHPKIIGLSDAAFRAIFEATFYSRRMLSDGFLDERVVLKRWGQAVADELGSNDAERPSWIRVERGWQIHDFEKHHPLRAEIEEKRRKVSTARAQAGSKGASLRWQTDSKPMANDSSETETETETETTPIQGSALEPVPKPSTARGARIPEPFLLTAAMKDWAAREVPDLDVAAATRQFVDYWRGESGAKATKLDWLSAWRFWMRRDGNPTARRGSRPSKDDQARDILAMGARLQQQEIES